MVNENNGVMSSEDIIIRKVTLDDNFEEIAQLIYETDQYIYPYWFHNDLDECKKVLPPLIKEDGFFFNYQSMYVAIDKKTNKIIGLVAVVDQHTNFDYDYTELRQNSESYRFTIDHYIFELINEVRELQLPYFSNVAVHHDYRGKKVGSLMMQYVIKECKEKYDKVILDVLSENPSAIRLYQQVGFEITSPVILGIGDGELEKVGTYKMEADFKKKH